MLNFLNYIKTKITHPIILGLIAIFAVTSFFIIGNKNLEITKERPEKQIQEKIVQDKKIEGVEISAKSAAVYDFKTGKLLYGKAEDVPLPLASLTKIMTALVALESTTTEAIVTIDDTALSTEGDSGLARNERWNISNLISYMLTISSNDAAAAVSLAFSKNRPEEKTDSHFKNLMNEESKKLNLKQTTFTNPTGLDENIKIAGSYGSAKDVLTMFEALVRKSPSSVEATRKSAVSIDSLDKKHLAINTNQSVENLPGIIASKTGYTDLSGGNLAVIFDAGPGHPIGIAVLGSSKEGRFEDVKELQRKTLEFLASEE